MKTLAIDHGANTGYAFTEDDNLANYGMFKVSGVSIGDKLLDFSGKVTDLIGTFKPDVLAIEKPSHDRNAKTNLVLIGYYTQLLLLASFHCIEVNAIHPTSLKKEITGNGKAQKDLVAKCVCDEYNLIRSAVVPCEYYKSGSQKGKPRPNTEKYDITDAIALATYAYRRNKK